MNKSFIFSVLFLIFGIGKSFSSNQFEISLLTCSSGAELFTAWGHSAIRIVDTDKSTDIVYNFGLFDFDTPNFHLKFVQGKLKYKLGTHSSRGFFTSYISENRQIIEQKLNLSDEDELEIIARLEYLNLPENRYYYYDFVRKNCTSELRDIIFENVETNFEKKTFDKTARQMINGYLADKLWLRFGMSLIMGTHIDASIDSYQSMFLPDYLCYELRNIQADGHRLIESERIFNETKTQKSDYPILLNPIFVFSLLLILVFIIKSKKLQLPLFLITGITGLVILSVWLVTEHLELKNNFNLLWCNPLYLLAIWFQIKKNLKWERYLSIFLLVLIVVTFIIWIFRVQDFDLAFIPAIIILLVFNYRNFRNKYAIRVQ